jgi:hypothetical protein
LQEGNTIRSGELKQGAMRQIEKAGRGADALVFSGSIAKVSGQEPAVLFDKNSAVELVQVG